MQTYSPPQSTRDIPRLLDAIGHVQDFLGVNADPIADLDTLRQLPSGTFGRAWADFIDENQLSPFSKGIRRQQLHDGIHVLTSYGSDLVGEAQVQAFLLGAKFRLLNAIIAAGFWRRLQRARSLGECGLSRTEIRDRLWQAYQRGRTSKLDPDAWRPEELWELPLARVRANFAI